MRNLIRRNSIGEADNGSVRAITGVLLNINIEAVNEARLYSNEM